MNMVEIGFEEIASYLRGSGWRRSLSGPFAEVWHPRDDEQSSVFVPKEPDSPDFLTALKILTREVSRVENRPEKEIHLAISRQFVDVTDLRAEDEGIADGTIPLIAGIGLFNSAHRMMVSAAAATLHRQSYYGNSMPRAAHKHARRMRLGQTRPGSYIVPVISSARFGTLISEEFGEPRLEATADDSYFERRMLTTLSKALETLSALTVSGGRTPSKLDVLSAVDEGVSSELCAAVLDVIGKGGVEAFDVTFNWAPSSPAPRGLAERIEFPSAAAELIERVEFDLKETDAPAERILYGVIRRLSLGKNDTTGHVTLETVLDGKSRTVSFDLPLHVYRRAAHYHGERRPVIVRGFLDAPPGRRATMNVTAFDADRAVASFEDVADIETE
ncbi:hypothetical protein [Streptomyces sp. NBC_00198]|uniref:hypothetical protein n=1 Tax=Streptomyces sp. NBC_00198 TaxID=2975677 RepID=UPI002250F385|nr:hypothetical protein [Streptomyces sp. NBC_00198]MCX5284107.1 hypothetical protein [Streptomyces sp. NBC_00198]